MHTCLILHPALLDLDSEARRRTAASRNRRVSAERGQILRSTPTPALNSKIAQKRWNLRQQRAVAAMRSLEHALAERGFKSVVGVDESGRGTIAGPVVSAACHIPIGLEAEPACAEWLAQV